ncbi:unnamed protein product, partial [Iphiclides podalirius]
MVRVQDVHGKLHAARVLLDNGSTSNFVTQRLSERLGLVRRLAGSTVNDASERAYGGCIYVRTVDVNGS